MTAVARPAADRPRRLGRLERSALTGVLVREVVNFSSYWRSATFSSTVEPTIYLLAFGFGFGSLVSRIGGYRYVEFVGTGTVATAVLFSSAFPAMFGTFVKYQFQRTYDAILAAPVDTEELRPYLVMAGVYIGASDRDPARWKAAVVDGNRVWTRGEDEATLAGTTFYCWSSGEYVFLITGSSDATNQAMIGALPGQAAPTPTPKPSPASSGSAEASGSSAASATASETAAATP